MINQMRVALFSFVCAAATACNYGSTDKSSSETQSLDNMAATASGDKETDHFCGLVFTKNEDLPEATQRFAREKRIKGATAALEGEVLGTLAAVPTELLTPFAKANGHIRVAASEQEAIDDCAVAPLTKEEKEIGAVAPRSCWRSVHAGSFEIVLAPSAERIRADLLRQVAFFFTEKFVEKGSKLEAAQTGLAFDFFQSFEKTEAALDAAFLEDVKSQNPAAHSVISTKLDAERRKKFVFAEALDSYYCSKSMESGKPREIFSRLYPGTWRVFTDGENQYSPVRLFGY